MTNCKFTLTELRSIVLIDINKVNYILDNNNLTISNITYDESNSFYFQLDSNLTHSADQNIDTQHISFQTPLSDNNSNILFLNPVKKQNRYLAIIEDWNGDKYVFGIGNGMSFDYIRYDTEYFVIEMLNNYKFPAYFVI